MAVVGGGRTTTREMDIATAVGRSLAERGAVVICGGLGGVMEGACRGAQAAGGTTVGILPGGDRGAGNAYLDIAVATGLGEARNTVVVRAADAVIAVGGEWGTLSEIAFAMKIGTPVIGLGTWDLRRAGATAAGVVVVTSPTAAVEQALAHAARR